MQEFLHRIKINRLSNRQKVTVVTVQKKTVSHIRATNKKTIRYLDNQSINLGMPRLKNYDLRIRRTKNYDAGIPASKSENENYDLGIPRSNCFCMGEMV